MLLKEVEKYPEKRNILLQSCFSLANDVSIVICKGKEEEKRKKDREKTYWNR